MNRFSRTLIYVVVLYWIFPVLAISQALLSIGPPDMDSPEVGDTLTIDVNITNAENVSAYQVNLAFDSTALLFVSVEFDDFLPGDPTIADILEIELFLIRPKRVETDWETGITKLAPAIAAASLVGAGGNSGTLVRVSFEVLEVKASTLDLIDVALSDPSGMPLDVTTASAIISVPKVTITEHVPGDEFLLLHGEVLQANIPFQCFIPIWETEIQVEANTFLEYQVAFPVGNLSRSGGVFVHTAEGGQIGGAPDAIDADWVHRKISLNPLVGQTIVAITLGTENGDDLRNPAGHLRMMVDHVQITDGMKILTPVWIGENSTNGLRNPIDPLGNILGMQNCEVFIVKDGGVSVALEERLSATWARVKTAR